MKKLIFIIIAIISIILTVIFLGSLGMSFGMQKKPTSIALPVELDSLDNHIQHKYGLENFENKFIGNVFNGNIYQEITEEDIEECRTNKKRNKNHLIFFVEMREIQNSAYKNEEIMKVEADSLYIIINKYLPYKECIDSIYINIFATEYDSIRHREDVLFDKTIKFPVKK